MLGTNFTELATTFFYSALIDVKAQLQLKPSHLKSALLHFT